MLRSALLRGLSRWMERNGTNADALGAQPVIDRHGLQVGIQRSSRHRQIRQCCWGGYQAGEAWHQIPRD